MAANYFIRHFRRFQTISANHNVETNAMKVKFVLRDVSVPPFQYGGYNNSRLDGPTLLCPSNK